VRRIAIETGHGDHSDAERRKNPALSADSGRDASRTRLYVGAIMASGTLLVLDASLPGGLIEGTGSLRYAQTMAFTTMVFFSLFAVFNARSDKKSAFVGLFSNPWLWGAVLLSLSLQVAVVYLPFLQRAFSTVSLSARDWLLCAAAASSVVWLGELRKVIARLASRIGPKARKNRAMPWQSDSGMTSGQTQPRLK
jgi:magnesium-transporting ATPase (P-type)